MGASVALPEDEVVLAPGQEITKEVRVRNTGGVVDRFELDVLGDAAAWTTVAPASINLLPGEESTARLVFSPPRTARVAAGPVPFALRVMSCEDTAGSVISEAAVSVEPFTTVAAELLPRTSRGSRVARHQLAVDNLGNHPTEIRVLASDPDERLDFRVIPDSFVAQPGTATFVKVKALPRRRFFKGQDKTLPFEISVVAPAADPVIVQGSVLQGPVIPPWLLKALLALGALLLMLWVLWQTMLKPEVKTTAREVAEEETAPLKSAVAETARTAAAAAASAEEARVAAGLPAKPVTTAGLPGAVGAGGAGGSPTDAATGTSAPGAVPSGTGGVLGPSAVDFRIPTTTAAGESKAFPYQGQPKNKVLWIADILLQNPRGDAGVLQIRRGEEVLLEFGLENFRDLDYHLIQPVSFSGRNPLVVAVECRNPEQRACSPSVYFTGRTSDAPSTETDAAPTPTPTPVPPPPPAPEFLGAPAMGKGD